MFNIVNASPVQRWRIVTALLGWPFMNTGYELTIEVMDGSVPTFSEGNESNLAGGYYFKNTNRMQLWVVTPRLIRHEAAHWLQDIIDDGSGQNRLTFDDLFPGLEVSAPQEYARLRTNIIRESGMEDAAEAVALWREDYSAFRGLYPAAANIWEQERWLKFGGAPIETLGRKRQLIKDQWHLLPNLGPRILASDWAPVLAGGLPLAKYPEVNLGFARANVNQIWKFEDGKFSRAYRPSAPPVASQDFMIEATETVYVHMRANSEFLDL